MPTRVAINGFGRIGRLVYRAGMKNSNLEFVAVNDLSDAKTLAHLLKYDSIHRKLDSDVKVQGNKIIVDGKTLEVLKQKELAGLPWGQMGIDIVLESSGKFTDKESASVHLKDGAKKVLISAPAKGADATIVLGVNDSMYNPQNHNVISIGSCTTNCLGPVAKILNDNFGIQKGFMTTIHAYTPSSSMPRITLAGGGEPPVMMCTGCTNARCCSGGAEISIVSTVGAPHMCVTPCSTIIGKMSAGSTARRQTCVPAIATTDHG